MNGKASQSTNVKKMRQPLRRFLAVASCMLVGCFMAAGAGQCATVPIRLLPQQLSQIQTEGMPSKLQALLAKMPPNYHQFGVAAVGKPAIPEALTLQFTANTTIILISTTPDFKVVSGGTCQIERHYAPGSTCRLLLRFAPQGAGPRLGKVTLYTSAGQTAIFGLMGYSSFPVVSFTPSVIETVAATISGKTGLINGAGNLAVDDGDDLYIPDTGNMVIRYIDSSGIMSTIASPGAGPSGVVVDLFGEVYFSEPSANSIFEIYDYGPVVQITGSGTDACKVGSSCLLSSEEVDNPGPMSTSDGNSIFFSDRTDGLALSVVQPLPATLVRLYNPFTYQTTPTGAFAADSNANLYTSWTAEGACEIVGQPLYDAENFAVYFDKIVGGRKCGFSGDGGQANGAEIGTQIGQIAFDLAGNMYFSDSANNRVRRVDASTGIIRTIAGSGKSGYTGDGGLATSAALGTPTGVAVDSQGQVYILTPSATTGTAEVVRVVNTTGALRFGSLAHGTASAPLLLNVANTGTANLTINAYRITGADSGDFTIDPGTTSCNFAAGNVLYAGQNCQIGVIFTPGAAGSRAAVLSLVDNTVNAVNKVKLTGTGT